MALDLQGLVLRQISENETNEIMIPRVYHDAGVTNRDGGRSMPSSTSASFFPSLPTLIWGFVHYLRQGNGLCLRSVFWFNLMPTLPLNISQKLCQSHDKGQT